MLSRTAKRTEIAAGVCAPDFENPYAVANDTSTFTVGAVISLRKGEGRIHPV